MRKSDGSIKISIMKCCATLCLTQILFMWIVRRIYSLPSSTFVSFTIINGTLHTAIFVFLFMRHKDFRLLPDMAPVRRVNVSNWLTIARGTSAPTALYLLIHVANYFIYGATLIFIAMIFLTDLLDGKIARRYKQQTRIGRYLDSSCDYFLMIPVTIAFYYYRLITMGFFILSISRMLAQCIGLLLVLLLSRGKQTYRHAFSGKASIFAMMTLYGVSLLQIFPLLREPLRPFMGLFEFGAAAFIVPAIWYKTAAIMTDLRSSKTLPANFALDDHQISHRYRDSR